MQGWEQDAAPDGGIGHATVLSLNRAAIVVKPGRAMLEWLHRIDPSSRTLRLEDLQLEPTVYMIPECNDEADVRRHLQRLCGYIFEEQLNGWIQDPAVWPARRDLETFDLWFEWSFHSMVIDLSDDPLHHDEF